jgi:hypothetical protein
VAAYRRQYLGLSAVQQPAGQQQVGSKAGFALKNRPNGERKQQTTISSKYHEHQQQLVHDTALASMMCIRCFAAVLQADCCSPDMGCSPLILQPSMHTLLLVLLLLLLQACPLLIMALNMCLGTCRALTA